MLSAARQRGFGVDDKARKKRAKYAMRLIVMEAKNSLSPERYEEHLDWLHSQLSSNSNEKSLDIGKGLLFTNIPGTPAPLDNEVRWVVARLIASAKTIHIHLVLREEISRQIIGGNGDEALVLCDRIEASLGESHWLISTRLYILQRFRGIDAQKEYLETLRRHASRCVSTVYAYFSSIRNEPSVSMQWFKDDVRKRQFSRKYPEHKTYLRFRLLGELPVNASSIADILRVEEAHSDVDLYETTISLLQSLHGTKLKGTDQSAVESCILQLLASISDPRIKKISVAFGLARDEVISSLPMSDETTLDAISTETAWTDSKSLDDKLSSDQAGAIWCVLGDQLSKGAEKGKLLEEISTRQDEIRQREDRPAEDIRHLLMTLCSRSGEFASAIEEAEKLARNLGGIPIGPFLSELASALREPTLVNLGNRLSKCALHTSTWGVLDRVFVASNTLFALSGANRGSELLADALIALQLPEQSGAKIAEQVSTLLVSATSGHPEDAFDLVERALESDAPLIRSWAGVTALELYTRAGDYQKALELVGRLEAAGAAFGVDLPIPLALGGLRKSHLKQFGRSVRCPVAITALLRESNDEGTKTLQRMSFNYFMGANGFLLPSHIPESVIRNDLAEYIYFLREVCVPHVMDMSQAFKSSQDLSTERRNICALLRTLDPTNQQLYDDEIVSITHALSIWEGIKLVDGSRIHVDEDAFVKAARTELEGSFNRYASLVRSGVGVAEDFDIVLKNILQQDGYAEGLSIPKNEADELLAAMVFRMKEMFLSNTIYGLDGYVSKRIRHGSLIGHLRGPVERHKLITQREKEGASYEQNRHWMDHFSGSDPELRRRLDRALADFSRSFDRELISMKDEKLQIKQKHSDGVFDITLSGAALHVIRSSIKGEVTFEGLAKAAVVSFWVLLSPALEQAQSHIRVKFQAKVSELFSKLQSAASPCVRNDPGYGEFINAIRLAQEETQIQIANVSGWFERTDTEDQRRNYSLQDAIDIGLESARSVYAGFNPYVVKRCDPVLMPSASLQLIADVLLIALGNICMHAGLGNEPAVDIEARLDDDKEVVRFAIVNSVAGKGCETETRETLEGIRAKIESRDLEPYVGSEGKSGLLKLAAMVFQSKNGEIDFAFSEEKFVLRFAMSFILSGDVRAEVGV